MLATNLERSLHQAIEVARERRHEYATLEHLLFALIEDEDAGPVLLACGVDRHRLRGEVGDYLDNGLLNLVVDLGNDPKPTASFQRVVQRAAKSVETANQEAFNQREVTGADVLVAIFSERESHAVYYLQEQDMSRFDAVNYISHGISKAPRAYETLGDVADDGQESEAPEEFPTTYPPQRAPIRDQAEAGFERLRAVESDLQNVESFVEDQSDRLMEARAGRIDLKPNTPNLEFLGPRIQAANNAINELIVACKSGNQQHVVLGKFAEEYQRELERIETTPGIVWYVTAQKIENYRSNYKALSDRDSREYPPLDAEFSTIVDTVVLASGILARSFPEIANCQDEFEKYAGRQIGSREAVRKLLDASLTDICSSEEVLTERASAVARDIEKLDIGETPETAEEATRTIATKAGFLRNFLSAIAAETVRLSTDQIKKLRQNIKSNAGYDISKEIVKYMAASGFSAVVIYINSAMPTLVALASQWRQMFGFIEPLLRIFGLS